MMLSGKKHLILSVTQVASDDFQAAQITSPEQLIVKILLREDSMIIKGLRNGGLLF